MFSPTTSFNTLNISKLVSHAYITGKSGSPHTYMNRRCDWLVKTIKDNKTIEMWVHDERNTYVNYKRWSCCLENEIAINTNPIIMKAHMYCCLEYTPVHYKSQYRFFLKKSDYICRVKWTSTIFQSVWKLMRVKSIPVYNTKLWQLGFPLRRNFDGFLVFAACGSSCKEMFLSSLNVIAASKIWENKFRWYTDIYICI